MTEKDWWERIREDPEDKLVLLAFADWLEEQGDAQAEGVRYLLGLELKAYLCSFPGPNGERVVAVCNGGSNWRPKTPRASLAILPQGLWEVLERELYKRLDKEPFYENYIWKHFRADEQGRWVEGPERLLRAWVRMKGLGGG